jgi:hypothetical protein
MKLVNILMLVASFANAGTVRFVAKHSYHAARATAKVSVHVTKTVVKAAAKAAY